MTVSIYGLLLGFLMIEINDEDFSKYIMYANVSSSMQMFLVHNDLADNLERL